MQKSKQRIMAGIACFALSISLVNCTMAATSGEDFEIYVNGTQVDAQYPKDIYNGVTYVCYLPIVQAAYPNSLAVWKDGKVYVTDEGFSMTIDPKSNYLECNGRCFYAASGFKMVNQALIVPAQTLAQALGGTAVWGGEYSLYFTTSETPIPTGDEVYNSDDLFWLSRIIFAESGNQSLEGQIAVGNVVLNRVASPSFPNSVYDVIYQRNQFTPVANKSINRTPSEDAVAAAKLALEGANTAKSSLYFVNPKVSPNSWASRARTYVMTIGSHAFYA